MMVECFHFMIGLIYQIVDNRNRINMTYGDAKSLSHPSVRVSTVDTGDQTRPSAICLIHHSG